MSKRTFIAQSIPISENLKLEIDEIQKNITGINIKWVEIQNLHLTLTFLGKTPLDKIDQISSNLKSILKNYNKYNISLRKLGAFKNISHPQVLWIGIEAENTLEKIYHEIQNLAGSFGFEQDNRPYRPHLTIGRIKSFSIENNLKELCEKYSQRINETVEADTIIYYESILTPTGSIYKPIETYKLS